MAHSHSHMSSHLPEDSNTRRLLYASGMTAGPILVEAVGGFLSGPLALLADAGHMLTDTAALFFALLAVQFSRRPPTIRYTFDWLRLTMLTAFVNVMTLVVITILIVWEMIKRLHTPRPIEGGMMIAIAVAGLLANTLSFWLLRHGSGEKNLSVRAVILHALEDPLGSVGTITAALIVTWTGWTPTNPILSIPASLLVLRSAWRLLKDNVSELLEGTSISLDIVEPECRVCRETPEVRNICRVHVWMVGEKPVVALHVQVTPSHDHDALLDQIQHYLMDHYQTERVTIQMEYRPCHRLDCHLSEGVSGHSHRRH